MGIIFNRGSDDEGCNSHHFKDYWLESITTEQNIMAPSPQPGVVKTKKSACEHKGCFETDTRTDRYVIEGFRQEDIMQKAEEKIDELIEELRDNE